MSETEITGINLKRIDCPKCGERGRFELHWTRNTKTGIIKNVFTTVQHWKEAYGKHSHNCLTQYIGLDKALELAPSFRDELGINQEAVTKKLGDIMCNGGTIRELSLLMKVSHRLSKGEKVLDIQRDLIEQLNPKRAPKRKHAKMEVELR